MPSKTPRSDLAAGAWLGAIAALGAADAYLHHRYPSHNLTLSEVVRTKVHTEHPVGEALFIAGWATLTAWLIPHILGPSRQTRAQKVLLSRLK